MRTVTALTAMLCAVVVWAQEPSDDQAASLPQTEVSTTTGNTPKPVADTTPDSPKSTALGTKADIIPPQKPLTSNEPVVGGMQFLQMIVALVVVFAVLKYGLPKLVGKFGKHLSTPLNSSITVEESANFGGGTLQVVTARGKTLLLSVAPNGVTCLADLTDSEAKSKQDPTFFELLDSAKGEVADSTRAVIETDDQPLITPKPNPKIKAYSSASTLSESDDKAHSQDLQERLRRLSRLVN